MDANRLQTDADASRSWENAATRGAILAAARRIAERDGILEMSLAAVADEADFAPAAIYSQFGSKTDLLLAVVGDDLATLAGAMRGVFENAAGGQGEPDAAPANKTGAGRPEPDRIPAGAADAIARLQKSVAALEQRPVDAWLERRLRELERALAAIEGRQAEKNTADQRVEERFHRLADNMQSLEQRLLATVEDTAQRLGQSLDASGTRLRQMLSETHSAASALDRRLTALENAAFAVRPELFPPPQEVAAPQDTANAEAACVATNVASAEPIETTAASAPYLDAARKSAQAAAVTQITRARKKSRRKSETMVYLSMGSFFLFVAMLTAIGFMLRNQAIGESSPTHTSRAPVQGAQVAKHEVRPTARNPEVRLASLAQSGNPDAELLVGLNDLSAGPRSDAQAAFQWLLRAASRHQPFAEYELGLMYRSGRGIRADQAQAFHWFESAALDGNRKAMHSLATCYAEGWGTRKDIAEAVRWFDRAATLGLVNDQFNLGVLYERGMGVPQNLVDAYKWYAVAAAQGDRESQARIAALASTLSPDDLAAARDAAAAFKPDTVLAAANDPPNPALLH